MNILENFIRVYWEYFLELEAQIIDTKRYVAFDKSNFHTYSIEYLKLFQAVCSEIDVVGKEIAVGTNPEFKIDNNTNIKKWGFEVQKAFPNLKDDMVIFNKEIEISPFTNWEYEISIGKKGQKNLRVVDDKPTIQWWKDYNDVKHQRTGLVSGTKNFALANQKNLITSLAALYLLETTYIDFCMNEAPYNEINTSKLFTTKFPPHS